MGRFQEFVKFCEQEEAAPSAGTPTPPSKPTNKYHFDFLKSELDIDDESFAGAMQGGVQTLYKIPDYGWGFVAQPPIQALIEPRDDDMYDVTFLFSQSNRKKIFHPYKAGDRPVPYEGEIEDQTVTMTKEDLSDCITPPLESMSTAGPGMPPGGPMGGMGGI